MKNPWKTKSIAQVYDNPWIEVTHRDVITPNNTAGIYGLVHFKNVAVGIVPIDQEGNTYLVGQYRYTIEQYSWELPEGGAPLGENPLDAAKRELKEETGLIADDWEQLIELHTSNSVTDEYAIGYLARGLTQGQAAPEDSEDLKVKKLPLQEAIEMALSGKITDAFSVAMLLKAAHAVS